jgi:antitoxin ParD1/3/4
MNVTVKLEPEFSQFINDLVESGTYETRGEVFRQALQLLKDREFLREHKLRSLKKDIELAELQYKQGKFRTYQSSDLHRLTESIKKDGRKRLASEKKKRNGA